HGDRDNYNLKNCIEIYNEVLYLIERYKKDISENFYTKKYKNISSDTTNSIKKKELIKYLQLKSFFSIPYFQTICISNYSAFLSPLTKMLNNVII
ncbi:MAG: hypothetical protein K6F46_09730, partial [Desulfovibrio sp.]|nr:hypothetical protein [Desulfovibrio sp.]